MRQPEDLQLMAAPGVDAELRQTGTAGEVAPRTHHDGEGDIVAALQRGDRRAALELLMRVHGGRIHGYCWRFLADESLADDVHQQVFAQAYFDLPRYAGRSSILIWLTGIAHHRCLDALKAGQRFQRRAELTAEVPAQPDSSPLADERIATSELAAVLRACLALVQPAARAAVMLRLCEGHSFQEMAEICGEKPGTLQARVARALPALRRCLMRKGVTP